MRAAGALALFVAGTVAFADATALSAVSDDLVRGSQATDAGVDVFWRPSSAFFLSAAVNPDFGQVEADNAVVNLSAYETFFPEKRLFFQENQDIFSTGEYGYGNAASPLHTRHDGRPFFVCLDGGCNSAVIAVLG